jgi:hypothetical protein
MSTPAPILSADGRFWTDPTDGRTVPVVRGGSDLATEPAGEAPPAPPAEEAPPAAPPAGEATGDAEAQEHGFDSIDDAVAALRETRQEAARRRTENKELSTKVEKFDQALAGYKPEEIDYLLEVFHDLSDPQAQKKAAKTLAEIADRVLESEGTTTRPTGEEDPDERPLTKKEWERLEAEKDQARAQEQALKQLEREATDKGYPPESPGYTVLLASLMEPDVAGDIDKAVKRVEEYEQSVVEKYRKQVEERGEKWPGAPATAATPAAEPGAGPPIGWGNARKAAAAFLAAKAGE